VPVEPFYVACVPYLSDALLKERRRDKKRSRYSLMITQLAKEDAAYLRDHWKLGSLPAAVSAALALAARMTKKGELQEFKDPV